MSSRKLKNTAKVPNKKNSEVKQGILVHREESYSGLIPHHSIVEGYERVCSGAADRILTMAESQLKIEQKLDEMNLENINKCRIDTIKYTARGQLYGFMLLLVAIISGVVLILNNKSVEGITALIASVGTSVASVLWNNFKK